MEDKVGYALWDLVSGNLVEWTEDAEVADTWITDLRDMLGGLDYGVGHHVGDLITHLWPPVI